MKRVLILAPQPFFLSRGTPINVRAMAETLASAGYQVDLLAFPFGEDIEIPGCSLLRSPAIPGISSVPIGPSWAKIILDIPFTFYALFLVFTRRYDVIHGIEEAGSIAGLLGLIRQVPYVYDMDSCIPTQLKESGFIKSKLLLNLVAKIESFFIRRSAAVLTVCSALTKKALTKVSKPSQIFQIEDFPYEPTTRFSSSTVDVLSEEFSLAEKRVVLYTGNLEQYQGIDLLIESFAKLPRSLNALLLVVGGSESALASYREFSAKLDAGERIVFTGSRPAEEMGAFMCAADVLVSPRIEGENTPLKIYSYMAAERVIVATNIHSHNQVLSEDVAFLPEPCAKDFAEALLMALTNRESVLERVAAAKNLVETKYSFHEFRRRLLEMYAIILNPSSSGIPETEDENTAHRYANAE